MTPSTRQDRHRERKLRVHVTKAYGIRPVPKEYAP